MTRLLPRSLQGQMLMAVALALLVAQGIGAGIAWRAQVERENNGIVHTLAFRLIGGRMLRVADGHEFRRTPGRLPHSIRLSAASISPITESDERKGDLEDRLSEILMSQGLEVSGVHVFERDIEGSAIAKAIVDRQALRRARGKGRPESIVIAAVRLESAENWLVARALRSDREPRFLRNLVMQTLLIYAVLVGAIALILRRITRPLAALTRRVEEFARAPALPLDGRIEPQGPLDTRSLIAAHNAMESRIGALLNEKDVMLGAIGHDLKTPLAALRVRIESVDDESERARMASTIEDIASTLDDILSLARVGRPTDPLEPTELSSLTASVIEEFEDMGEPVELGETERIVLPLRATWLRRAIRNLVSNALRYGGNARVTVRKRGGMAVIAVLDSGHGIPEDEIARMMQPFERGDPSRNRGTGGAGIGLTLARAIAEQHGGTLMLSNRSEGGLKAEIRLPLD